MRWPLRRRLYLTVDNNDRDLRPLGLEELLGPVLERALVATRATGAAIALSAGKEIGLLGRPGDCTRSRNAFRSKFRIFRNVCAERPKSVLRRHGDGPTS
jgi:hypothetical protein